MTLRTCALPLLSLPMACTRSTPGAVGDSDSITPNEARLSPPPAKSAGWSRMSIGWISGAAMASDGTWTCWGDTAAGNTTCPEGVYPDLSVGYIHGCALDEAGEVTCWGCDDPDNYYYDWCDGQTDPPAGPFESISTGQSQTCALDAAGALTCWGGQGLPILQPPTGGTYTKVSVGGFGCAVNTDREIVCWGSRNDLAQMWHPRGRFWVDIAVGFDHACALTESGRAVCWGGERPEVRRPPDALRFQSLGAGVSGTCGVTMAGGVRCWEDPYWSELEGPVIDPDVPVGTFVDVDVGSLLGCALSTSGTIECFGYTGGSQLGHAPDPP